jgi:sugar phosphate isomerase/epimerase
MNRRLFLRTASLAAAGGLCLAKSNPAHTRRKLTRIGMQLYMVRRELEKDFEGTLRRVAELGYREVEFAGYFDRPPKEVRALLDRHGLSSPAGHVTLAALGGDLGQIIEAAHVIGHEYVLVAWLAPEERKSLDDYRRHADLFNRAGEKLKKAGVQFAYHNHDFEFTPLDGRLPYDLLLERMDTGLVKLELDLYWITKGGADPLKYFAKQPGRFHLLHVKDIFAHARKAGVRHYFVEQDETPGSPFDSLKISMDYLKRLEF